MSEAIEGLPVERLVGPDDVFRPHWPEGLRGGEFYRVLCDDKGRNGGSWLQVFVSPADGDVHVSMQDWEHVPEGEPTPFPSVRIRTGIGGGRNERTRQALLWLAEAIRLDAEERERRMRPNASLSGSPAEGGDVGLKR